MFTDVPNDQFDLKKIDLYIKQNFPYVATSDFDLTVGKAYYVGYDPNHLIKLDLFHTDPFVFEKMVLDKIRMVNMKEIVAMKLEVIQNIGRKKDFWDIYELENYFTFQEMLEFHEIRYPYSHDRGLIINNFTKFEKADEESDPNCLKGNFWDVIKFDMVNWINKYK